MSFPKKPRTLFAQFTFLFIHNLIAAIYNISCQKPSHYLCYAAPTVSKKEMDVI